MKLFVLGATGTTGGLFVDDALAAGHEVVAYVRNPGKLAARDRLTVVAGNMGNVE
ncbi:NAD(P)H-binding protein [Arthrobacter sp. ERGS1:01]|uniref:NAD(P)H-binding protein n=1 Tax=Arthrobacter sp. ERGS1:01 TaxID=1704044 RepID=UPI0009E88D0E|nr:NAD(P)H-binding protein [Arthrobacter sp. ERGS1:01]